MMLKLLPDIWKNKYQILEGVKNRVFKRKDIEELYVYRVEGICKTCIWNSENQRGKKLEDIPAIIRQIKGDDIVASIESRKDRHCLHCGCNLATKGRCLTCNCPLMKWKAVTDETIAIEI